MTLDPTNENKEKIKKYIDKIKNCGEKLKI